MDQASPTRPRATEADPRIGVLIHDRYRIVRRIGAGGMGVVYEAEHVVIKRRVAIKCLHAQFADDPDAMARFHREALAATSVGNEHIIDVMDMGRFPDGAAYMVLEFLDGRSLAQDIKTQGPQPLGRAARIASQICDALAAAHAKGVVHRDLKPDNIFLLKQGDDPDFVKVLDFGISKFSGALDTGASATRTGLVMGTVHYMPPEQIRGAKDIDHRVDVYALGVILFRMLTGLHPFEDETVPMLALKIISMPPPSVRQFRPDIPVEFERVLLTMLAKDKHERYPDCTTVKAALAPFLRVASAPVMMSFADRPSTGTLVSDVPIAPLPTPIFGTPAEVVPITPSGPSYPTNPSGSTYPSGPSNTFVPPPHPRSFAAAIIVTTGLLAVALGLGAVALRSGSGPAAPVPAPAVPVPAAPVPAPAVPVVVAPAPHPPIAAPVPAPVPVAVPAPAVHEAPRGVHVQVMTQPETAEVFLDGHRIANPFDGELPTTVEARRLEARLAGYTTVVQDLVLQFPQTVRIRLVRGHGVEDRRHAATQGTPLAHAPPAGLPVAAPVFAPPPRHADPSPGPVPSPGSSGTGAVAPPPSQGLLQNPF